MHQPSVEHAPYIPHNMLNPKKCFEAVDNDHFNTEHIREYFDAPLYAEFFHVSLIDLNRHVGPHSTFAYKGTLIEYFEILYAYLNGHFPAIQQPDNDVKTALIQKISEGIAQCSPGFLNRIQSIISGIHLPRQLSELLATYRKHIVEKVCNSVQEVHNHNRYFVIANQMGLAIPYNADRDVYRGAETDDAIRDKLQKAFDAHYTPCEIVSNVFLSVLHGFEYCGNKTNSGGYTLKVYQAITQYFCDFFDDNEIGCQDVFLTNDDYLLYDINWLFISGRLMNLLSEYGFLFDVAPSMKHKLGRFLSFFSNHIEYSPVSLTRQYDTIHISKRLTVHRNDFNKEDSILLFEQKGSKKDTETAKGMTHRALLGATFNGQVPILGCLDENELQELIDCAYPAYYSQVGTCALLLNSIPPQGHTTLRNELFKSLLAYSVYIRDDKKRKKILTVMANHAHYHHADLDFVVAFCSRIHPDSATYFLSALNDNPELNLTNERVLQLFTQADIDNSMPRKAAYWPFLVDSVQSEADFKLTFAQLCEQDQVKLIRDVTINLSNRFLLSIYENRQLRTPFVKSKNAIVLSALVDKIAPRLESADEFCSAFLALIDPEHRKQLINASQYSLDYFAEHADELMTGVAKYQQYLITSLINKLYECAVVNDQLRIEADVPISAQERKQLIEHHQHNKLVTLYRTASQERSPLTEVLFTLLSSHVQNDSSLFAHTFPDLTPAHKESLLHSLCDDFEYLILDDRFLFCLQAHVSPDQLATIFSKTQLTTRHIATTMDKLSKNDRSFTEDQNEKVATLLLNTQRDRYDHAQLSARYGKFCNAPYRHVSFMTNKQDIINIFLNYLHPRGGTVLSGHWNRHHHKQAQHIVDRLKQGRYTDYQSADQVQALLEEQFQSALLERNGDLDAFLTGSFSRRIFYASQKLSGQYARAPELSWSNTPPFVPVFNIINLITSTIILTIKTVAFTLTRLSANLKKTVKPFRQSEFYDSSLFSNQAMARFRTEGVADLTHTNRFAAQCFGVCQALIETLLNLVFLPTRAISTWVNGRSNPMSHLRDESFLLTVNTEILDHLEEKPPHNQHSKRTVKYVERALRQHNLPLKTLTKAGENLIRQHYGMPPALSKGQV